MPILPILITILALLVLIGLLTMVAIILRGVNNVADQIGRSEKPKVKEPDYPVSPINAREISRRERPTATAEPKPAAAPAPAPEPSIAVDDTPFLADIVPTLRTWSPIAYTSLAARITAGGSGARQTLNYKGSLTALDEPVIPGWLAYDLSLTQGQGVLHLRTTDHHLLLQLNTAQSAIPVVADGQPLGRIEPHPTKPPLFLLSPIGVHVGEYQRPRPLAVEITNAGHLRPNEGSVLLDSQLLADLNCNIVTPSEFDSLQPTIFPLIQNPAISYTRRQEHWLLALVAFEIYSAIQRTTD